MSPMVLVDHLDQVAVITLNRPERHNSLVPDFLEEILAALGSIRSQPQMRAIILQANGRSFSTGGDVRVLYDNLERIKEYADNIVELLNQVILDLVALPQPVVAAVHGIVTGGSLGFVLASDIVLVTPQASFTPYYSVVGFSPDGGWTAILPEIIGARRAAETLILNQTITAEQAVAWGLASRVVPAEGLFDLALKTAQDIALKQPGSIARTKTLLRADLPKVRDGLQAEKSQFVEQIASEEARRAMQVFLKIEDRG